MNEKTFKRIFTSCLALGLAAFSAASASALDISFDGASGGVSLSEAVSAIGAQPASLPRPVPSLSGGARVYDFKTLYTTLGYPALPHLTDSEEGMRQFGATDDEVTDLATYTSKEDAYYKEINGYLRYYPGPYDWYGISPDEAKRIVHNIDSVFAKAPSLPADLVLFRGVDLNYHAGKPYADGEEFTDKGYVSTSASYKVARYFAVEMNEKDAAPPRKAIFSIYLARSVKGILIDHAEDEVILKHGMKFRVMVKKDNVKKYDLYLVQACSAACETSVRPDVAAFWSGFDVQD